MLCSVEGGCVVVSSVRGCVVVRLGRRLCCGQLREEVVLWSVQ